jgi:hypothetical protein
VRQPIAPLGPNYIRLSCELGTSTSSHWCRRSIARVEHQRHRAQVRLAPRPHMRTKTLVVFRSRSIGVEEEKMEPAHVSAPETIWEPSVVTEE